MVHGQACMSYRMQQRKSRRSFFENKYQEAKEQSDKLKAAFIQAINDAEYMNLLWPRFHKYGINQIDIPVYDDQGEISEFRSVTEPSENFSHLIRRNSDHFFQAKSSPFVEGIFGQDLPPFQQNDFSPEGLSLLPVTDDLPVNNTPGSSVKKMKFLNGIVLLVKKVF